MIDYILTFENYSDPFLSLNFVFRKVSLNSLNVQIN